MKEVNEVETKELSQPTVFDSKYGSRQVLDLLSEKWTALVLYALAFGVKRHVAEIEDARLDYDHKARAVAS